MSTPTTLPTSKKYYNPLYTKTSFIPAIEAANMVPEYAEWAARCQFPGEEIADLAGWAAAVEQIPTPGMTAFTGAVPGRKTVENSTITFYADIEGNDVRTVLTEGLEGFIAHADGGDEAGKLVDIFPVRVASVGKVRTVTGQTAAQITVAFSILRAPAIDVVIPAAPEA